MTARMFNAVLVIIAKKANNQIFYNGESVKSVMVQCIKCH